VKSSSSSTPDVSWSDGRLRRAWQTGAGVAALIGSKYSSATSGATYPSFCSPTITAMTEAGIIRKILFVPPSMLASDLLRRMQVNRTQMALVIDEYGGTDGLASHEDIVEMVVGDIDDEHDDEEVMFKRVSEDMFVADARVELEDIAEAIGPDFDITEQVDEVDTLGGLIFSELGRIPVRGEVVQALPGFEFHILDADPRRIKRVRITRKRQAIRRRVKADGDGAHGADHSDERQTETPTAN